MQVQFLDYYATYDYALIDNLFKCLATATVEPWTAECIWTRAGRMRGGALGGHKVMSSCLLTFEKLRYTLLPPIFFFSRSYQSLLTS